MHTAVSAPCRVSPCQLSYHGGPLVTTANLYTIFWLPPGWHFEQSNDGNAPNAADMRYETLINQFFSDLQGSTYYNVLRQYSNAPSVNGASSMFPTSPNIQNVVTLAGSAVVTDPLPADTPPCNGGAAGVSLDEINTEVTNVIQAHNWPTTIIGSGGVTETTPAGYLIYTPFGLDIGTYSNGFGYCSGLSFGAYHTNSIQPILDTPYAVMWDISGDAQGAPTPAPATGDPFVDNETPATAHELAEMVTDPLPISGWAQGAAEVADLCEGVPYTNQTLQLGSHQYDVPLLASNETGDCESSRAFAPLTVTASDASMTYGAPAPAISPSYSGFQYGDTAANLTTPPACTTTATSSPPGVYPTSCAAAVDPNYAIAYQTGALTVTAAPLTVTASSPSMTYGGAVPAITPSYSGLVNGDLAPATAPSCATTATSTSPVGAYPTSCAGAAAGNYGIGYVAGAVTVNPASQSITFGPLPNHTLGDAPFTVSATASSGQPVTFTAGPATVCSSGGSNGATITLVGAGLCTVTASQPGNQNYLAALSVAQSFTVAGALTLALGLSSSPAGPVTTGSTVMATMMLGNHTASAQTVKLKVTLAYKGTRGSLSLTLPLTLKLNAGQTVSKSVSFTIWFYFPRGAYTLSGVATDGSGDSASSSASLTIS